MEVQSRPVRYSKKKNRSGTTSIVVAVKIQGKFKEIKTIGVSSDESEIEHFYQDGRIWADSQVKGENLFQQRTQDVEEAYLTDLLLSNIENILHNGTQLILNRVYDQPDKPGFFQF